MASVDPIRSLCGALTQATGGVYHVDLRMPDGIHRLAEVVERKLESPSTAPGFAGSVTTSVELSTGLDAALDRADQH